MPVAARRTNGRPSRRRWPNARAPRQVAERIASEIKRWIETKRPLANRGRAVAPRDMLILVQSRGALFQEIIRALRQAGLPTPGADRLAVTGHIAVLDLLALCDVLLNPADDLQLAALLRSPLFDISEDDLFELAQPREKGRRCGRRLKARPLPPALAAYQRAGALARRARFRAAVRIFDPGALCRGRAASASMPGWATRSMRCLPNCSNWRSSHEQGSQPSLQGFVADDAPARTVDQARTGRGRLRACA